VVATLNEGGWNEKRRNGWAAENNKRGNAHSPSEALQSRDPRLQIRLVRVRLANLALPKKMNLYNLCFFLEATHARIEDWFKSEE
jgi:hypothetical protein